MKRLLFMILTAFLLVSCSSQTPEDTDVPDVPKETVKVWDVEPVYEYEDIDTSFIEPIYYGDVLYHNSAITYNNHDLYNTAGLGSYIGSYEKGGVFVYKNGLFGVMNRNGELVIDLQYDSFTPPSRMMANNPVGMACQLNDDYTEGVCTDAWGIGGAYTSLGYLKEDGTLRREFDNSIFNIYDVFRQAVDAGYLSEDEHLLYHSYTENGASDALEGYAVVGKDSLFLLENSKDMWSRGYSDGMILLCRGVPDPNTFRMNFTDYTFYDEEGKTISSYEEAYGFYEGYAPAKKDGKWGYIDKNGECLTGYIFDKATPLSEGKAWVIYKGRLGRLNVLDMIDKKVPFTEDTFSIDSYELKEDPSHWIVIDADSINIRTEPSTSAYKTGKVTKGMKLTYREKTESDGYTWYKLLSERWIADKNGEWVKEQ